MDGFFVATTAFELTQVTFNLDGPIGLDGTVVSGEDLIDRGTEGYASATFFMEGLMVKSLNLLKVPDNYSQFANGFNWTRDVGREQKQRMMENVFGNASENAAASQAAKRADQVMDGLQGYGQTSGSGSESTTDKNTP